MQSKLDLYWYLIPNISKEKNTDQSKKELKNFEKKFQTYKLKNEINTNSEKDLIKYSKYVQKESINYIEQSLMINPDSTRAKIGGLLLSPALQYMRDNLDFRKHGAVMLLGVQGPIFIGHGRSDSTAIASALITADYAIKNNVALALDEEARLISSSKTQ